MTGDGEALGNIGSRKRFLHILDAIREAAAFVGSKRYNRLAVKIDVLEQREHNLGIGAPPDGTADEDSVIPFTTHEGSGLANCVEDVKEAFPGANVTKGFAIYGHEVRTGRAKVEKWLKEL